MAQWGVRLKDGGLRVGLGKFREALPGIGKRVLRRLLLRVIRAVTRYPAERPGQKYIRTGLYGRSFKLVTKHMGASAGYTIKSDAVQKGRHYTRYVGGNSAGEGQAWMHQGRWPVVREELDGELEHIYAEMDADVATTLRQHGIGL